MIDTLTKRAGVSALVGRGTSLAGPFPPDRQQLTFLNDGYQAAFLNLVKSEGFRLVPLPGHSPAMMGVAPDRCGQRAIHCQTRCTPQRKFGDLSAAVDIASIQSTLEPQE